MKLEYRYLLRRVMDPDIITRPRPLGVCMLNPSIAGPKPSDPNDPTITRVIGFAVRQRYRDIVVGNLYPLVATNPKALAAATEAERVGDIQLADDAIRKLGALCGTVLLAWGAQGDRYPHRVARVRELLKGHELVCLGRTKAGQPKHPLYSKATTPFEGCFT